MRIAIVILASTIVAGCANSRQEPTQSPADVRGFILANRTLLWRDQLIRNASLAIPPKDPAHLWRACVHMNIKNAFGVAGDKEFLVGARLDGRPPELLIADTETICVALPHAPFPELEAGYLENKPAKIPKLN